MTTRITSYNVCYTKLLRACHGFPPFKDIQGNRVVIGDAYDGGYAYTSGTHNYDASGYLKAENLTPHNSHAAGSLAQGAASDYLFGTGQGACDPCHFSYNFV